MTRAAVAKRLAAIEAEVERLLPREPDPLDPLGWLAWLSSGELARLEAHIERQLEGDAEVDLPDDLYRRAISRAPLGIDARQLDETERAGQRLLRVDHPDRPGDKMAVLYVTATEDLVERGRWHLDPHYVDRWPGLPAELTAVEVERLAAVPGPWPGSCGARHRGARHG
jgi:hypothetical protein